MKKARVLAFAVTTTLVVALVLWWGGRRSSPIKTNRSESPQSASTRVTAPRATTPSEDEVIQRSGRQTDDEPQWELFLDRLAHVESGSESRGILSELRGLLEALPPKAAAEYIQKFLLSPRDASTKLDLTVKAGGALADASSLRVFLLDYVAQVDLPAAASLGRQILQRPTSPDEWAVSMRNVARERSDEGTLALLQQKAGELISHPEWQKNPSSGFLEAFDVIVHTRAVQLTPQLATLLRDKENRAVAHAAYLTLDRLALEDPVTILGKLAADPKAMEGREQTRANYFARGDVRDPQQRSLLEQYLLDPQRSPMELQTFAGIFPNANYMISSNLLTSPETPRGTELIDRDRSSLEAVEGWLSDPRFAPIRPQLITIHNRLQEFVRQASVSVQ